MGQAEHPSQGWDENDSEKFIDYGYIFVPDRERQHEIIAGAIPKATDSFKIVDLCCGEGYLDKVILEKFPQHQLHAYDGSEKMIMKAKSNLHQFENRFSITLFDLTQDDWRSFPWKVHAIVSSLGIHHLDDAQKQKLYRDLAVGLTSGGALIIADVIQPTNDLGVKIAAQEWDNATQQRSLNFNGNLEAFDYFQKVHWNMYSDPEPDEADKPSTLYSQLQWLEKSGLINVDVFWMRAGHVIFGGYKP